MRKLAVVLILALLTPTAAFASGESIGSLSHIHNVKVFGKKIYLGTHAGLYEYVDAKTVSKVSPEIFDVMGLTIDGKGIYASGHPGPGSKLPEPVGLLFSSNGGKTWKKVSLQGKVDFHLLEAYQQELYGADSQSGDLMYSKDFGKKWISLGKNEFSEIAINPMKKRSALAIRGGKLLLTQDNFKSTSELKVDIQPSQIEWNSQFLVASAGKNLYRSLNEGKTWKNLYSFKDTVGILAHSTELLVAVVGNEVYRSTDGGRSFTVIA